MSYCGISSPIYLPPNRGDVPIAPAEAGSWSVDPMGIKNWVTAGNRGTMDRYSRSKGCLGVIYMDQGKACYIVPRPRLLLKLQSCYWWTSSPLELRTSSQTDNRELWYQLQDRVRLVLSGDKFVPLLCQSGYDCEFLTLRICKRHKDDAGTLW